MSSSMSSLLPLALVALMGASGCSDSTPQSGAGDTVEMGDAAGDSTAPSATTPVYVTMVGHIESTPQWADCPNVYPEKRQQLLAFAERFAATGARMNLQIDFPFFEGASLCETPDMAIDYAGTDANNVVDFVAKHHGIEIDPHRSGGYEAPGEPNYADVRQIGGRVTERITEIVGGLIYTDAAMFERLDQGEAGTLAATTMTWKPEVLSMAAAFEHHLGDFSDDDRTSGIWKPTGTGDDFYVHDDSKRMVYIGPGQQHADWNGTCKFQFAEPVDYIKVIQRYLDEGRIPADRIYTVSIGVPQSVMFGNEEGQAYLERMIAAMKPLVEQGKVIHATYSEVLEAWETTYNAQPNQFSLDHIDPADYTCPR